MFFCVDGWALFRISAILNGEVDSGQKTSLRELEHLNVQKASTVQKAAHKMSAIFFIYAVSAGVVNDLGGGNVF